MERFKKIWYQLTKYWPRPVPETKEQFEELKMVLMKYFNTEDTSVGWITLASQIQGAKTAYLRKPYYFYANACRKINRINGMCENEKRFEAEKLQARLKELASKVANESTDSVQEGPHNPEEHVQVVS